MAPPNRTSYSVAASKAVCGPLKGEYRQQVPIGAGTAAAQTAAGLALSPDTAQRFLYVADLGNSRIDIFDRKTMQPVGAFGSTAFLLSLQG